MTMEAEEDIIPGDQDENVGGEPPKRKREKKRKSKEERIRDRRMVMILFMVVLVITLIFYLWPMLSSFKLEGGGEWKIKAPEWKGYSEVDM